jgi:hypothetical protein
MDQPSQSTIENQAVAETSVETVPTPLEFEHEPAYNHVMNVSI